jgi:5-methylcytosine-specific restriction endonuclease McrA
MHARMDRQVAKVRKTVRNQAVEDAEFSCQTCGKWIGDWGHAHHIVPRSRGGKWEIGNIAYLCEKCHFKIHQSGAL